MITKICTRENIKRYKSKHAINMKAKKNLIATLSRAGAASALIALVVAVAPPAGAQDRAKPTIQLINMGGSDCPPCLSWRAIELPKLEAMPVFKEIQYVHVEKVIRSPVPPRFFLPTAIKPLKEKLDVASGGRQGSAQVVVVVNGEVFDYWWGNGKSAADLDSMFRAILQGGKYPFSRCVEFYSGAGDWNCKKLIAPEVG
jgi:hypothetical protein